MVKKDLMVLTKITKGKNDIYDIRRKNKIKT